jgi:hypothetical protein
VAPEHLRDSKTTARFEHPKSFLETGNFVKANLESVTAAAAGVAREQAAFSKVH